MYNCFTIPCSKAFLGESQSLEILLRSSWWCSFPVGWEMLTTEKNNFLLQKTFYLKNVRRILHKIMFSPFKNLGLDATILVVYSLIGEKVKWFIFLFQMVFWALAVVFCYATFLQNQPRFFFINGEDFSNFMIFLRGIVFHPFFEIFCDS